MKVTKVIFLDIDGVLNTPSDLKNAHTLLFIDSTKVERLNRIISATDARLVLSSTWRRFDYCVEYLKQHMELVGQTPVGVKEQWSGNYTRRGKEIQAWLDTFPIKKYIILDDDGDMLEHQLPFFIQTDTYVGLTDDHVDRAIEILNGR